MINFLNPLRFNYYISKILTTIAKPIQEVSQKLDKGIRGKIWVNGKAVKYDGFTIKFPKDIGVSYCSSIYWNDVKGFEPNTWKTIKYFIKRSDIFFDIGSNIGFYSILAKKLKPEAKTISYEPIKSIYRQNIIFHELNNLPHDNVINAAIAEKKGTTEIFLPIDPYNNNSIELESTATLRKDSWQFNNKHYSYSVQTLNLDSLVDSIQPHENVFLKIDVEDYEAKVLEGGVNFLNTIRPIIICEILKRTHGNQKTLEILEKCNYVCFGISDVGFIRFKKENFYMQRSFNDFLLLHESIAPETNYFLFENMNALFH